MLNSFVCLFRCIDTITLNYLSGGFYNYIRKQTLNESPNLIGFGKLI